MRASPQPRHSIRSFVATFQLSGVAPPALNLERVKRGPSRQSVEYFGWTFSPRIFAIALFAAMAASPKPIVMSVIFPS